MSRINAAERIAVASLAALIPRIFMAAFLDEGV
jgi:hypothetical protein